ncbi:uncharacterized protein LOC136039967 isoform X4 [Artemia franciscana]|uniref:uncharacterized protein LOC136039967 isoform X4 n=1 Tax=Artemia franciscana TaxID=6661 RepID=UPI0032DB4D92
MIIGLNCQQTKDIGIMKTTIKLRKPSLEAGVIRPVEDGNINWVDMDFEIMEQMSSYAPVQSPGPSPLYLASVTLSVGTSRKSPMSQTAIHSSLTQHSQHKYMSRFHTNIFQLWIQVLLAHQCKLYKTMWKYKLPNVRR